MMKKMVVAIGGNVISDPSKKEPVGSQIKKIERIMIQLKKLTKDYHFIFTHGNGSEIGNLLIQQEKSKHILPEIPLDTLGAMTQGQIGYWLQQSIENILHKKAITIITCVLVDKRDIAFKKPSKPIGPYYKEKIFPCMIKEKEGWRRLVASPEPRKIIDIKVIRNLIKRDFIVITCGGGGIPVVRTGKGLKGIEAVIDKDLTAALLARAVNADLLAILTDVPNVYLNYGKESQRRLRKMTVSNAKRFLNRGHFPAGSMGPKIRASLAFMEASRGRKEVIITKIDQLERALKGEAGTLIFKG